MNLHSPLSHPNLEVLEDRWLHKVMVFIQSFHHRPLTFNRAALLLLFGGIFALWQMIAPSVALAATLVFITAALLDLLVLWILPRRGISFGPIAPQLLTMLLPRLAVTALSLLIAVWQPTAALWTMLILQVFGSAAYLWGLLIEPHRLSLTSLELSVSDFPADAPPIRLLHLSDIHLERLTRRENRLLQLIQSARPDLIVITGDYLNLSYNNDSKAIAQVRNLLAKIDAPYGVYATLGSPPVDLPEIAAAHFTDSHIHLLQGNVMELDLGQGRALNLIGMDCTHDMAFDGQMFSALVAQKNGRGASLLLYHSPEMMPLVQQHNVDLYLCGHTHGGQVRIPGYGALITSAVTGKRYEMGRYDENGTTLYVSRGIGLEGSSAPRLRLFCPPEITLVEIKDEGGRMKDEG
ncbi:MAG: hypothetical protein B6243_06580 [Anaerolineaceae bacterium 4572_5.2]|nr:MAG: hypothetical protein B6243_06580 [Anaerolineaceae bacterium 4572_5.2]